MWGSELSDQGLFFVFGADIHCEGRAASRVLFAKKMANWSYLTQCMNQMVSEDQLPHKPSNSKQQVERRNNELRVATIHWYYR